jgi:DNA-binding NarL/FixJ family response regulator
MSARNEVLRLVAGGKSNREIAGALTISLNTVARHISNIFDKIGAATTEAAAYARRY